VFDLLQPLDSTVVDTPIGGSSSFGAGPEEQGQILQNVGSTVDLAVVSGYHMGGTFDELHDRGRQRFDRRLGYRQQQLQRHGRNVRLGLRFAGVEGSRWRWRLCAGSGRDPA
jgi:hypothetical protein